MRYLKCSVFTAVMLFVVGITAASAQVPVFTYDVINRFPHDQSAFTQGLVLAGGKLYESTGLFGSSTLREVDLRTGAVLRRIDVPSQFFAEGMTIFQGKIFQLTWQSQVGFIYDPATFNQIGQFSYSGEGWGLTHDDRHLILSDGTNRIRFLDPVTFQTVRSISVFDEQSQPLTNINELEYINGEIYANVWQTDQIVRIDPLTGALLARIDLTGLLSAGTSADVLNGIAYDPTTGHLLVTGKLWPTLFEIDVRATTGSPSITAPQPGSTLTTTSATFSWTAGAGASRYWLSVGSSAGGADLFNQDMGASLTATVAGLPTDGRSLYVRLWWVQNGAWQLADFTYTAMSGGGGTTPGITAPEITSPAPGATLAGSSAVFQWTTGTETSRYWLYVGSAAGGADLFNQDFGSSLSGSVTGLPIDGRTLYVRLWWVRNGAWAFADFTYTAASGGGGGGGGTTSPQITAPSAGATLAGSTAAFQWTAGTGTSRYWLYVGSAAGGNDLFDRDVGTSQTVTATGLPTDGRTLYVRLWWLRNGSWEAADVTFRAAGG